MRPEDHESDRLYRNILQCAKGVLADVEVFASSLEIFIHERLWKVGWYDSVHQKVMRAPSLAEFIKRPIPKGAGASIEVVHGLLDAQAQLKNKHAIAALKAFDDQLKREGFKGDEPSKLVFDQAVKEAIPRLPEPAKGGRGKKTKTNSLSFTSGSTHAATTLARLKRDHPKLAERVVTGELSANAAAIEAGFRKKQTGLDLLRKGWKTATAKERSTFLTEIKNERRR